MKLRLFVLAFLVTSHVSFAGNTVSSPQEEKIKIANSAVLKERLEKTVYNEDFLKDFLNSVEFFDIFGHVFADNEMSINGLNKRLASLSRYFRKSIEIKLRQEEKTLKQENKEILYHGFVPKFTPRVNAKSLEIESIILEILLKEDYLDLYEELTEKK